MALITIVKNAHIQLNWIWLVKIKLNNYLDLTQNNFCNLEYQVPIKPKMISFTDAIPKPRTMMIISSNTPIAISAMFCTEWLFNIANCTISFFNKKHFWMFSLMIQRFLSLLIWFIINLNMNILNIPCFLFLTWWCFITWFTWKFYLWKNFLEFLVKKLIRYIWIIMFNIFSICSRIFKRHRNLQIRSKH